MWWSLTVGVIVLLAVQTVLVAAVHVLRPRANIYVLIVLVSIVTAPFVWLMADTLLGTPVTTNGRLFLTAIHLALGGFLFHFMTLPDRSVTLRILVELLLTPGQTMSVSDLRKRYSVRTMIESRLQQLSAGGFLAIGSDGRITLIGKGQWFGRFVVGGRRLFGIASAN